LMSKRCLHGKLQFQSADEFVHQQVLEVPIS